jgi:hypothetical protein
LRCLDGPHSVTTGALTGKLHRNKNPDLIPIYAHLLCNEPLSDVTDAAAQHLLQRAIDTGLLRLEGGDEEQELCSEPMMMRVLHVSAATADVELRRLANRLEALLLEEFPTKLVRQ